MGAEDHADLRIVAELHARLLDFGPLAALGPGFLRTVCYRAVAVTFELPMASAR